MFTPGGGGGADVGYLIKLVPPPREEFDWKVCPHGQVI